MKTTVVTFLLVGLASGWIARAAPAEDVVAPGESARVVAIRDLRVGPTSIEGRLVNSSDGRVENVRLLVTDTFHWSDEMHPGPESPGRADYVTVAQSIPPRGSVPFRLERAPLPERSDGRFATTVQVVGVVRYPPEGP